MVSENISEKLKEEGWSIKDEFLDGLQHQFHSYQSVVNTLKNSDLKECGSSSLPRELGKGKSCQIKLPVILQVTNVRNVAAPKANEESEAAPRMLRITLTDGLNYVHGLELSFIQSVSLKTAPGTKLKLQSKINVAGSYLLLEPSNVYYVGGVVDELYEKWKLSQSISKFCRVVNTLDGCGPPPWVPFGRRIMVERDQDFKALGDVTVKKEDDDFEHQIQKTVMELSKEGSQKVFGGGKQMLDSNVQKIIQSGGFTIEEAEWALKKNKNDVHRAILELRSVQMGVAVEEYPSRSLASFEERGKTQGGRRGRGRGARGRGQAGPDGSDDEMPQIGVPRPSRPASLLDYLESKFLDKSEMKSESQYQSYHTDEKVDFLRNSRGRKRGQGDSRQKQMRQIEPSLSGENWPSLVKETHGDSRPRAQETNAALNEGSEEMQPKYNAGRSANSNPDTFNFRDSEYAPRYNQQQNYKQTYRDNNYSNYREKANHYRDQQSTYKESDYQQHPSSSFKKEYSSRYEGNETYNGSPYSRPKRAEQRYYRRGMGRSTGRGSGGYARNQDYYGATSSSGPNHFGQQSGERGDYYAYEGNRNSVGSAAGTRVLSKNEQALIADFERSMVMSGVYETPRYNMQNRNSYQGANSNYSNNRNYQQDYSGTYEYHYGGDGYARNSRSRRGSRY